MSTLNPARDATSASAAVTVVFPTPPLPATTTTWEVEQNCLTSISACYGSPHATPAYDATSAARDARASYAPGDGRVARRGRRDPGAAVLRVECRRAGRAGGRPFRYRRRAGAGTARPAERRADRAVDRARRTRPIDAARVPVELQRRGRRRCRPSRRPRAWCARPGRGVGR